MIGMPSSMESRKASDTQYESGYGDVWFWWRNFTYMVREQCAVGLLVVLVIGVADAALYFYAPRVYKSQASFVVDQSPFQFGENQNDVEGSRLLLQSIISSITSYDMREVIAERLNVPPKNVCIIGLGPKALWLNEPNEVNLSVTTERGSRVATIEALSGSPDFASNAANAVLDEILGLNRLGGRLNDVNLRITAAQAQVNQYVQNVSTADANRAELEQDELGIERHLKAGGSLESAPAFAQDEALINLQKRRIDADSAYFAQTQVSVQGQQLRALSGAKTSVDHQIQDYLRNRAIAVRSAADDAVARVASLKADLEQQVDTLNKLQREKTELSNAVGDFKLRRQLGLFNPDAAASEANVIIVTDRAHAAWKPAKPIFAIYLMAGIGLAGLLGLGLMFLRHNLDRSIKYPQQIELATGVPCLAVMVEPTGTGKTDRAYLPKGDAVSGLSYLRNQLLRGNAMGYENRIVSFMDLGASEAASSLVAQLAWLLASSGKSTLLVDLDFKKPGLAKALNIAEAAGLSEWVRSSSPLTEFIQKSEIAKLGLLQPGKDRRDLDAQLSRRPLAPVLEKMQGTWDYILIYVPSLLENPHILLAAPGDSPVISLVEYGRATLDDLNQAIAQAEVFHFRFAGVVLHHFPVKRLRNRKNLFGLGAHRYVFNHQTQAVQA